VHDHRFVIDSHTFVSFIIASAATAFASNLLPYRDIGRQDPLLPTIILEFSSSRITPTTRGVQVGLHYMATTTTATTSVANTVNTNLAHLSHEEQDTLKAAVFQRLHPRLYLERFFAEDIRPDGRTFDGFRDVSVNVGEL